jgi:hypothetical protein
MNQFRRVPRAFIPLLPVAVLAAVFEPAALLLAAPWLAALVWVIVKGGSEALEGPSAAEAARERLVVR